MKTGKKQLDRGFTLMEIMTVIIIIGVLASVAIPSYLNTVEKSKSAEGVQILTALLNAQRALQQSTGSYATNLNQLEITIPTSQNFSTPRVTNFTSKLAAINSLSSGYTLIIDQDGKICCSSATTGFCQKLGYNTC